MITAAQAREVAELSNNKWLKSIRDSIPSYIRDRAIDGKYSIDLGSEFFDREYIKELHDSGYTLIYSEDRTLVTISWK